MKKQMTKATLLLLLVATAFGANAQGEPQTQEELKLIETLKYERGSYIASDEERDKLTELVFEMRADSTLKIQVIGYSDKWGSKEVNDRFSYIRAKYISDWMRSCRVPLQQIAYIGAGVDSLATDDDEARRVEVLQVFELGVGSEELGVESEELGVEGEELGVESEELGVESEELGVESEELGVESEELEVESEEVIEPTTTPNSSLLTLNYYIGAGVGTTLGWSTFDGSGFKAQILGGVEFSELISAELSLGYSSMNMKSSECCENLYYANGKRFFAPVAGEKSYRYGDIDSKVSLIQLSAKVNFNLVSIWCKDSRWSGLVSPKIGYIYSSADLDGVTKESASHFSTGVDLSGQYDITENWGVRLTSGVDYVTGEGVDAMPQCEHTNNTLWSTTLGVIYKF